MASCIFKSSYILTETQKSLEYYIKERDEERKAICKKYIKQHFFLSWVLFWLKPLTQKDIEKNLSRYLNLSEIIIYEWYNVNAISICKSIINLCKDSMHISLTAKEYNIIKL
jgi:hypothetical protein